MIIMISFYFLIILVCRASSAVIIWVGQAQECTPPILFLGIGYGHMKTDNVEFPIEVKMPEPDEPRKYCQGNDMCTYNMITTETTCMQMFPFGDVCKTDKECAINLDLDSHENFLSMVCEHAVCTSKGLKCKTLGEGCHEIPCCPGFFCEEPREVTEWVFLGQNWDKRRVLLFSKQKSNQRIIPQGNKHSHFGIKSNLFGKFEHNHKALKSQKALFATKKSRVGTKGGVVCVGKTKIDVKVTKKLAVPGDKSEGDFPPLPQINKGVKRKTKILYTKKFPNLQKSTGKSNPSTKIKNHSHVNRTITKE